MMQKIQRFGGAMFTPVLLFAFSGIMVGIATVCTSSVIVGSIADVTTTWYKIWFVIKEGAWTLFRQVPMLFVVSLPIGLAKKQQARACMEAFVLYLTFNYFIAALLTNWAPSFGIDYAVDAGNGTGLAMIASIKTLDTSMVGALVVSGVAVYLHNKFFDTKLPEWLGVFKGSCFVCAVGFFVMLALAVVFCFVWPPIQNFMKMMQGFFMGSGVIGVWVYTFLERILIPTGLHHFVYMPFAYESVAVDGGCKAAWALNMSEYAASSGSLAELFPAGRFMLYGHSKLFAAPGISLAFYATAKKNKKKEVMGLMIPVALTAILCGITEPIEFTFLFAAPFLWPIHAALAATLATIEYFVVGISGDYSSGLINWFALDWLPMAKNHMGQIVMQIVVGLIFTAIWFFLFSFLIKKFDLKTPGREDDDEEAKLMTKKEYKAAMAGEDTSNDPTASIAVEGGDAGKAKAFLALCGGKDNIADVTNCATRLRLTLKDDSVLADASAFKKAGAHGLVHKGKAIQIIVGLSVPSVREEFENLLD